MVGTLKAATLPLVATALSAGSGVGAVELSGKKQGKRSHHRRNKRVYFAPVKEVGAGQESFIDYTRFQDLSRGGDPDAAAPEDVLDADDAGVSGDDFQQGLLTVGMEGGANEDGSAAASSADAEDDAEEGEEYEAGDDDVAFLQLRSDDVDFLEANPKDAAVQEVRKILEQALSNIVDHSAGGSGAGKQALRGRKDTAEAAETSLSRMQRLLGKLPKHNNSAGLITGTTSVVSPRAQLLLSKVATTLESGAEFDLARFLDSGPIPRAVKEKVAKILRGMIKRMQK